MRILLGMSEAPALSSASALPPLADGWFDLWLGYALFFAPYVVGIAALLTLFLFGRAKRNALALFSAGMFCLVNGAVWMAAFSASYYARMDNAYLLNLLLGWWLMMLGVALLMGSLAGAGVHPLIALALWIAFVVGFLFEGRLGGPFAPSGGTPFMLYAAIVIGVAVLALLLRTQWLMLGKGLLGGGISTALLLLVYGVGRTPILLFGFSGPQEGFYKPPYVDVPEIVGWLMIGMALFLLARLWSRPPQPMESQPVGPPVPQP